MYYDLVRPVDECLGVQLPAYRTSLHTVCDNTLANLYW